MIKLRNLLLAATGFVMLVIMMAIVNGNSAGADRVDDVRVINATTEPVPITAQGTTSIAGTVGINPESNTVQIGNTSNNPLLVRDADDRARQPFQKKLELTIGALEGDDGVATASFQVPPGKLVVIEFASCSGFLAAQNAEPTLFITTSVQSEAADHFISLTPQLINNFTRFAASQQMKVFADPGTTVNVTFSAPRVVFGAFVKVSISGYLEDV